MDADVTLTLDRWERGTAVAALIHYALAVYEPSECINVLSKLAPDSPKPWLDIVTEARQARRQIDIAAEEAAALREP